MTLRAAGFTKRKYAIILCSVQSTSHRSNGTIDYVVGLGSISVLETQHIRNTHWPGSSAVGTKAYQGRRHWNVIGPSDGAFDFTQWAL